jgi:hypothetical protein
MENTTKTNNIISQSEVFSPNLRCQKTQYIEENYVTPIRNYDCLRIYEDLAFFRMKKLQVFTNKDYNSSGCIAGIRITYENRKNNQEYKTETFGHFSPWDRTYTFAENEYITNIKIRHGWILDKLFLILNTGKTVDFGGSGGSIKDFNLKGKVVLGFYFNVERTNIMGMGLYTVEDKQYNLKLNPKYKLLLLCNYAKYRDLIIKMDDKALSPEVAVIKTGLSKPIVQKKIFEFL